MSDYPLEQIFEIENIPAEFQANWLLYLETIDIGSNQIPAEEILPPRLVFDLVRMGRQYVVEEYYKGLPVCIVFLRHTLIGTDKVSRIVWIKAAIDAIAEWDEVHTRVRDEKGNLVTGFKNSSSNYPNVRIKAPSANRLTPYRDADNRAFFGPFEAEVEASGSWHKAGKFYLTCHYERDRTL